jgi:hypothetical protein
VVGVKRLIFVAIFVVLVVATKEVFSIQQEEE